MAIPRKHMRMTAQELQDFLSTQRTLRLATVDQDGWPHVVPLWLYWDGDVFWIHNFRRAKRTRLLEQGTRMALVIDAGYSYEELRGMTCRADYEFASERVATDDARHGFAQKYHGGKEMKWRTSFQWLRLHPHDIRTWDFRKLS